MKSLFVATISVVVLGAGLAVAWIAKPFSSKPADVPVVSTPVKLEPQPAEPSRPGEKPPDSSLAFAQFPPPKAARPGQPAEPELKPEPLPDLPQADPKSKLTQMLKDQKLYMEKLPNGDVRILFPAEVCLREGLLEVFLCKKNTKEHEAILRTDIDARFLHAALIAAGATVGKPMQFLNPKTSEQEYKPASGQKVRVLLHYSTAGKTQTVPAQEWILDKKTKKPMAHDWVFAGSRFVKNPDRPNDPDYYCANNGEVICISNFVDSMLDLPVEVSREAADLQFDAIPAKIPPLKSQVWVILELVPEKKK